MSRQPLRLLPVIPPLKERTYALSVKIVGVQKRASAVEQAARSTKLHKPHCQVSVRHQPETELAKAEPATTNYVSGDVR